MGVRETIYEDIMISLAFGIADEKDLIKLVTSAVKSIIWKDLIDKDVEVTIENIKNKENRFILEITVPMFDLNFCVVMNRFNKKVKLDGKLKFLDWFDRQPFTKEEWYARYDKKEK